MNSWNLKLKTQKHLHQQQQQQNEVLRYKPNKLCTKSEKIYKKTIERKQELKK